MSAIAQTALAFDPGREKCGFALLSFPAAGDDSIVVIRRGIVLPTEAAALWTALADEHPGLILLVGNGTGSQSLCQSLNRAGAVCLTVDERFTTRRARERYFIEKPPRGWRRLIPRGLLTPPRPVDDLAAVLLAEDWFKAQRSMCEADLPLRSGSAAPQSRADERS